MTELQRTEPLSLSKFLHLPVSVNGAFLINYVSSLLRLSLIVFVPVMLGFCLALVVRQGDVAAARAAADWRLSADGHGADVSVSGLAGLADEQSPPPPDGDRGHDGDLHADLSVAQPAELLRALGANGGQTSPRSSWKNWPKLDRAVQAENSMPIEHLRRQQEVIEKHKLATEQADRESAEQLRADGPARESGLAGRLAAAGRHVRGRGPCRCRRFWGFWE